MDQEETLTPVATEALTSTVIVEEAPHGMQAFAELSSDFAERMQYFDQSRSRCPMNSAVYWHIPNDK